MIQSWQLWMDAAELAERTIADRIETVLLFAQRMSVEPSTAGWEDIAGFLANPGWKPGTRRTRWAQLRSFYRWLQQTDQRVDDPMLKLKKPKAPRGRPHPVPPGDIPAVLSKANRRRTKAMVILMICQGLRAFEVAKFRGEDIRGGQLHVVGKGGADDVIPVHPLVVELADQFPKIGWWFPSYSEHTDHVTSQTVSEVVSGCLTRAGVAGSGHHLRHFFGTEALRSAGGNLRTAQELLRHASPATTAIYTDIAEEEKRAAIDGLPIPLYALG